MTEGLGKILVIAGVAIAVIGVVLVFLGRTPFLGKLHGDIIIKKDGVSFYFPVVTLLLTSIVLTVIINLILRFIAK